MKKIILTASFLTLFSASVFAQDTPAITGGALNRELAIKDSLFFNVALNSCKVQQLPAFFTGDFIFLHDRGLHEQTHLQTGADFFKSIAASCGKAKVRREVAGLQSFWLNDKAAIQTGVQRFYVN